MKLEWEDDFFHRAFIRNNDSTLTLEVCLKLTPMRGDWKQVNSVVFLEERRGGIVCAVAEIPFRGDLSRGKALAESLAAWWLEQKPMSK